jgi:hypothetical protein
VSCNPEGVSEHSPGSRVCERTLGKQMESSSGPRRGHLRNTDVGARTMTPLGNPFGVQDADSLSTQGALAKPRDPGLRWVTPSGNAVKDFGV